jgi:nitrogen fixation protein NifX
MPTIAHKLELAGGSAMREGRCSPSVRVALASQDGRALDAHFGFARKLMVYEVTPRSHRLVSVITFSAQSADDAEDEDKITPKVRALAGCHILLALAIGPPAAAKVIQANVHPVRIGVAESIEAAMARVRTMMTVEPPWWLRRILLEN